MLTARGDLSSIASADYCVDPTGANIVFIYEKDRPQNRRNDKRGTLLVSRHNRAPLHTLGNPTSSFVVGLRWENPTVMISKPMRNLANKQTNIDENITSLAKVIILYTI